MATGLLSDWFDEDQRGLVMSVFNWGIYGGYGIAFPIGRYVPEINAWDLVSLSALIPDSISYNGFYVFFIDTAKLCLRGHRILGSSLGPDTCRRKAEIELDRDFGNREKQ